MNPIAKKVKDKISGWLPIEDREDFGRSFDDLYENIDDKIGSVNAKVTQLKRDGENAIYQYKNGFSSAEVWNFGDCITDRFANICGYLYDAAYIDRPDYLDECLQAEHVFRAVGKFDDSLLDVGHSDIMSYRDTFDLEEKVRKNVFMPQWMWMFDNLLDPDVYIAPVSPNDNMFEDLKGKFTSEITYAEVENLPITETRRISRIMKKFADNCWGCSDKYAESDDAFMTIEERGGDKWKQGQSLSIGLFTHRGSQWHDNIWVHKDGFVSQRTREELGLDWVAWVEDVLHAGDMLELYADWFDPSPALKDEYGRKVKTSHTHSLSLRESMRLLDREEADKLENEIVSETRKVWIWMGKIGRGFWD